MYIYYNYFVCVCRRNVIIKAPPTPLPNFLRGDPPRTRNLLSSHWAGVSLVNFLKFLKKFLTENVVSSLADKKRIGSVNSGYFGLQKKVFLEPFQKNIISIYRKKNL